MSYLKEKKIIIAFVIFIIINFLLHVFSPEGSYLASDSPGYIRLAKHMATEGTYSPEEWRLMPGYPMFLAPFLIFTDNIAGPVVFTQVLLLFVIGLIAKKIIEYFLPHYGFIVLLLIIFNPNALYYAQTAVPDNLFSFFFILFLFYLIQSYRQNLMKYALFAGIYAGIMTLIRPNGIYILWTMPIFIGIGSILSSNRFNKKVALHCVASFVIAFLVLSPLFYNNWIKSGRFQLVPEKYRNHAIYVNLAHGEMMISNISQSEAEKVVEEKARKLAGIIYSEGINLKRVEYEEIAAIHAIDILLDHPPIALIRGILKALAIFFFSGGAGAWMDFFQVDAIKTSQAIYPSSEQVPIFKALFNHWASAIINVIALGFVFISRALAFLGCVAIFKQRKWEFIAIFGGIIAFFTFICGFIGYSRYRVPIEPLLAMFAAWGVEQIRLIKRK